MRIESVWTFVAATTGAVGQHTIFTITGDIVCDVIGVCSSDLSSGGGTLSVGTAGNVNGILPTKTATNIDSGGVWSNNTLATQLVAHHDGSGERIIGNGWDITMNILTATITGGVITFYCLWRPLSSDANIIVATPS